MATAIPAPDDKRIITKEIETMDNKTNEKCTCGYRASDHKAPRGNFNVPNCPTGWGLLKPSLR